ncbi:MAG: hypothetical protein ACI36V_00090 [Coriobacteriales bacterium]
MKFPRKSRASKLLATSLSAAMAVSFCVPTAALAASDASKYVSCASYRAAEPAPELLGLSNVATNTAWAKVGELNWGAPYYYLFGTSTYNSNPNPYMVNAVYNAQNADAIAAGSKTAATPAMVFDGYRTGGPTASVEPYGAVEGNETVWDMLPDVILGNNKGYDYNSAEFAGAAAAANGVSSYSTIGVVYDSTNIYTMIDSMYNLASAGKKAAASTGKTTRYGNPTDIAENYELYVKGIQGYVLKKLGSKEKKTVALISNYDPATETYTLVPTGVAEGTAASNRYLEAVQFVAKNLGDEKQTVTAAELDGVDLIMVGSQAGSEVLSDTETIVGSLSASQQKKTYWVNSANGSAGSCYGVVMNSVENAQNFGRIMGCLYPEYVDQSDLVAYYYQNFYHLKTSSLSAAIANAMDGVRNWNNTAADATSWEKSDVKDYSEAAVEKILMAGCKYIKNNSSKVSSYLALTKELSTQSIVVDSAQKTKTVKASAVKKAAVKTSKVEVSGVTGTVSYSKAGGSKKLSVGSAGRITVAKGTAKGTYSVKVKVKAAASSVAAATSKTVTVKVKVA